MCMTTISRQEVLHIAQSSQLLIDDNEINKIIEQLSNVLTYAASVQQVTIKNIVGQQPLLSNVFRADQVQVTDYQPIMACAPHEEGNCFIVPMILDQK